MEKEQRAILGGGCLALAIAFTLLAISVACAFLDKIL